MRGLREPKLSLVVNESTHMRNRLGSETLVSKVRVCPGITIRIVLIGGVRPVRLRAPLRGSRSIARSSPSSGCQQDPYTHKFACTAVLVLMYPPYTADT